MAAVSRSAARAPVLPKETIDDAAVVEAIGGAVIVRGMLLTERLALFVDNLPVTGADGADGAGGDSPPARFVHIPRVLAATVLAGDNRPLWNEATWEEFGATNFEVSLRLFGVAQRLSGLDIEDAKKN